jgi:hypothetical protein
VSKGVLKNLTNQQWGLIISLLSIKVLRELDFFLFVIISWVSLKKSLLFAIFLPAIAMSSLLESLILICLYTILLKSIKESKPFLIDPSE